MTSTIPRPSVAELESLARQVRLKIIETVAASKAGHIGGPLSAADALVALYFAQLNIDPADPAKEDRDRFILSKGHCAIALYAVLALRGYFPVEELSTFDQGDSRLQGHPDMLLTPGIDVSTGSLGMGLSAGAGIALGAKKLGKDFHTWVMLGDGELAEGMVWEMAFSAPRQGLDNLTAIIDLNGLQQYGFSGTEHDRFDRGEPIGGVDLERVFTGFGWHAITIDGHDFTQILAAFDEATGSRGAHDRPTVIISRTTKGKGVSFAEGTYRWHNGVPSPEQVTAAWAELGNGVER